MSLYLRGTDLSNISLVAYSLLGLLAGGLINVLADHLPRREPPDVPACPFCHKQRPWHSWLAVTGYLLRQGGCVYCGARIPSRHLLTELATALLFVFLWQRYSPSSRLFFETLYTAIFVLLCVTDLEHKLILHVTTLPAIFLAIVGSFFLGREGYSWRLALLGGATGFFLVWGMYLFGRLFVHLVERVRGQKIGEVAFGFGDVTLTTFIGVVVGFPNVIFALLAGILLGGVGGAIYWLFRAINRRDYSLFTAIPYGPFLIAGGWSFMIWGQDFLGWYFG
jgi:leader peptidase (prepilin peptidase)/N-methyltransferase